ncbi:hypothetical protein D3C87_2092190 [compost metagenome]
MVPTFYDSIELAKERMIAKFHRRDGRWGAALAFLLTFVEAILALVFVRLVFRLVKKLFSFVTGKQRNQPA